MVLVLAVACAPDPVVFEFEPATLDFGTVDFPPEMPGEAYAELPLSVTNTGEAEGTLRLPEPDPEIFCIRGFTTQEFPVDLGAVGSGSTYAFTVGLCGYPPGDAGSLVETAFDIETSGSPGTLSVPVTFTPNRLTE